MLSHSISNTQIDSKQISALIEENLNAKSMDFARLPEGELHKGNPTWFTSGLNRVGYNGVTCARFSMDDLDERVKTTLEPFRSSKTPLTWWVGPLSEPASLGRTLQLHGFVHNRDMIGMAAQLDKLVEFVSPDFDYEFEPVLSREDLQAWLPLFMETFGVPTNEKDLSLDVFSQLSFGAKSQWLHYFIKVDGQIVATSSLHTGACVAGLYNIATQREYRQHGLGTAITSLTFYQAQKMGYSIGTLQTSYPNALRLYHRMGFEVYCKFGIYQKTW